MGIIHQAMLRKGNGEPLVLLHGVTGSERMWQRVIPLTAPHHDTIAPTLLGHRGGPPGRAGTTVRDVIDDAERRLDELGLERPHLAGNSLGGWVALELARRGRARSVCALSPAGCWEPGGAGQSSAVRRLRAVVRSTQASRWALPLLARAAPVRRIAFRDTATHGERLEAGEVVEMADDLLACTVRDELLGTGEQLAPMDPLPCPVTLAWAGRDRLFPPEVNGARARSLVPQAEWKVLPGVGHVPMIDAPELVAQVILATTARARATI